MYMVSFIRYKKNVEGDGLKYSDLLYNVCMKDYLVAFFCCDYQNVSGEPGPTSSVVSGNRSKCIVIN